MKKLTIAQILASFGENPIDENLHVYLQKKSISYLPIDYPFRLDHFTILIIDSGECEIKLDLIDYTLKENDLLVLLPHTVGQFIYLSDNLLINVVSFSIKMPITLGIDHKHLDSFRFLSSQYAGKISIPQYESLNVKSLMQLLEQKNKLADNYPFREEIVLNCFRLFLFEISAIFKINTLSINHYNRQETLSHEFIKLLLEYMPENKNLSFYANLLSVTPNYLTKLTKLSTGKTAGVLIDEMIILQSKLLLHETGLSIAKVSELLFFTDQFIFSRFFRKNTGLSPTEYRRQRM